MRLGRLAATVLLGALSSAPIVGEARSSRTVEDVVEDLAPKLRSGLARRFKAAGVAYPPTELTLIAYKKARKLEV